MTNSLYQNIQALGNRMASNLETMGVSASFNDGGLTLADKILDINAFNDGVFLASDKKIGQSSNTVHLSAMVVDDGMFKVGEPVIIEDRVNTTPIYTKTHINEDPEQPDVLSEAIGSDGWGLVFGSYSGSATAPFIHIWNNDESTIVVEKTSTGFHISGDIYYFDSELPEYIDTTLTGTILYYYNGTLFTETGNSISNFHTLYDNFDFDTVGELEGTVSFYRIYGGGITGNNGAVGGIYTCSGAGLKEIVAKSGSVVSQPYEITDCIFYDDGVTNPKTKTWYNQDNSFTLTPSNDGTLVSSSASGNKALFADGTTFSNSFKFNGNLCVEVEIVSNSSNNCNFTIMSNKNPQITLNGAGIYKLILNGTTVTKYKDGEVIGTTTDVTQQPVAVGFRVDNSGSFKFKDFKVYPI